MMDTRPATKSTKEDVARRLEKQPGAQLIWDSVKRVRIPETQYEATIFLFQLRDKIVFVAELVTPGLPHIYNSHAVVLDEKENAKLVVQALLGLSVSVHTDLRFRRNVVLLNGGGAP